MSAQHRRWRCRLCGHVIVQPALAVSHPCPKRGGALTPLTPEKAER